MKYAPHTGKEHVPSAGRTSGNRRRLIPETETEKALVASLLRQAGSRHASDGAERSTRFGGEPAAALLPDSPDKVDAGWFGYEYTVAPSDFESWITFSDHQCVRGYSCVVEHPHRTGEKRLEVWHHVPEQEGCSGGAVGTSDFPIALLEAEDKIKADAEVDAASEAA